MRYIRTMRTFTRISILLLLIVASCVIGQDVVALNETSSTEPPPPPKCGFLFYCEFCGGAKTVCCSYFDSHNVCCSQPHEECAYDTDNVYSVNKRQEKPKDWQYCGWGARCTTCGQGKTVCCGKLEYPLTCCEIYIHRDCDDPNERHVYELSNRNYNTERVFAKLRQTKSGARRGLVTLTIIRQGVSDLVNVRLQGVRVKDNQLFSVEVGPNKKCGAEVTSSITIFDSPVRSGKDNKLRLMTSLVNDLPVTLRLLTSRVTNETFACGTLTVKKTLV